MPRIVELGIIPTLCSYFLPWAMPVIKASHPGIRLSVCEDFTANLIDRLSSHQLDAAIVSLPVAHFRKCDPAYGEGVAGEVSHVPTTDSSDLRTASGPLEAAE